MSTENIYQAVLREAARQHQIRPFRDHLDIGSGNGSLIRLFQDRFGTRARACDYTDELMKLPGQKVDIANLNDQPLPYSAGSFDIDRNRRRGPCIEIGRSQLETPFAGAQQDAAENGDCHPPI